MAIYGGIIGGLIAARLVSRKHKISMLTLLDVVAPALVLGQGIGRWGNYINMEAYGLRIAEESLQFFPLPWRFPSATCGIGTWRRSSMNFAGICLSLCC